ncbi:MAG: hypothetical protein K0S20_569, partial [Patescibacteria group bacterium]|nr:hypothetical protein [Patescibacteria group bacterium]
MTTHITKAGLVLSPYEDADQERVERLLQCIEPTLIGRAVFPQSEGIYDEPKTTQLLAERDGELVGYAIVRQESEDEKKRFVWILIEPKVRRQRLASQILQYILKNYINPEVSTLTTWTVANEQGGDGFAQGAGFEKSHSSSRKALSIEHFDFAPFEAEMHRIKESDYKVHFLKEAFPSSESDRQGLYRLNTQGLEGMPGHNSSFPSYE